MTHSPERPLLDAEKVGDLAPGDEMQIGLVTTGVMAKSSVVAKISCTKSASPEFSALVLHYSTSIAIVLQRVSPLSPRPTPP
jgi:hypothetical protein